MSNLVRLLALDTARPAHRLEQGEVAAAASVLFSDRDKDFARLARVFDTSGVRSRWSTQPIAWFTEPHGWADRNAAYVEGARDLFVVAARKALAAADVPARDIHTVVTVSSTGVATPSLDAHAFASLGLSPTVRRVPIFGLGCAGGAAGLGIASSLAAAHPGKHVLVVVVEVCTLAFRLDKLTKANVVATALFGDGAAACILRADTADPDPRAAGLAIVEGSGDHLWADTLDIMGWGVDQHGLDVVFSRSIPRFAETKVGPAVAVILASMGLSPSDIDRFVCHPGGAKVITALERALDLTDGSLDHERAVLAEHGNMSAPTVLFVLKRVLEAGLPSRALLCAMGPGFSLNCVSLRRPS
ncbi:type III polyketide synthase [Lichenihabitans sp. PAMC28606]|uniref:type III polyketide synthase n=1 Tax=Lichenihabitans sp. PAMC28606 TaxID=2880932 RepID=UPI001D0BB172|nr:3-oxoacyl-[acyl-carrier-protein] synthase III C-terminal domain-containing protein [Lichenihabitans sp. PAMC28606]UDL94427.1 type III polyketide synthase [Lichenihabitans sp. PAMC28606]